jgi:hypothetical protein
MYDSPPGDSGLEGWELYTDYDPACGIYVPTEAKYLPEPIRWESCSVMEHGHGLPGPDGMECRTIALDHDGGEPDKLSLARAADVVGGKVRLLIGRDVGSRTYRMIADIDGPVHQALFHTGGCGLGGFKMRGGNVMYRMYDTDATDTYWPGGAIGGPVESLRPRVYLPKGHLPSTTFSQEYDVGAHYFIEAVGNDTIYSMESGLPVGKIVPPREDEGMIYGDYRFLNDDAFWVGDNGARTAIKVWNPTEGVRTLVGWPGDNTRAAAGIGVDGVDMVWVEAQGRSEMSFARYDVWTAKYTTKADVVEATKRRLLTNNLNSTFEDFVVGCGYAAVKINPVHAWGQSSGFLLIRLSDAMTWTVEDESLEQQRNDLDIGRPLALTCDEIVVEAFTKNDPQIARIRLASLGPGTPAQ